MHPRHRFRACAVASRALAGMAVLAAGMAGAAADPHGAGPAGSPPDTVAVAVPGPEDVVVNTTPWQRQVGVPCNSNGACVGTVIVLGPKLRLEIDHISCYAKVGGRSTVTIYNAYLNLAGFYLDFRLDWQRGEPVGGQVYTFSRDTSFTVRSGQTLQAVMEYYGGPPTYQSVYCDLFGTLSTLR